MDRSHSVIKGNETMWFGKNERQKERERERERERESQNCFHYYLHYFNGFCFMRKNNNKKQ